MDNREFQFVCRELFSLLLLLGFKQRFRPSPSMLCHTWFDSERVIVSIDYENRAGEMNVDIYPAPSVTGLTDMENYVSLSARLDNILYFYGVSKEIDFQEELKGGTFDVQKNLELHAKALEKYTKDILLGDLVLLDEIRKFTKKRFD